MDYTTLKTEIKEIANLAQEVPEDFRQKTFELLLNRLLESQEPVEKTAAIPAIPVADVPPVTDQSSRKRETPANGNGIPMRAPIRVFMQRTNVTLDELQRVVMVEDGEVHFVREPSHGKVARGQMEWALLLALKNALLQGDLSTDPEDVRSICQEKGYYDPANFASTFKTTTNASYFRGPMERQGPRQALSPDGQTELAQLIKRLGSAE